MRVSLENLAQFAREFVASLPPKGDRARVFGLRGDLGSGKTTFVQHVAHELGVTESVTSPTFVIMQKYETAHPEVPTLVHIDAYRLRPEEAHTIGWDAVLQDPEALVLVEWPELLGEHFPQAPTLAFSVLGEIDREIEYVR